MQGLKSQRKDAAAGKATSLIIFLHGYGADGSDLLSIGEALAPHLPATMFIAPDAPEPCRGNPDGYQWFPVPRMDGASESEMLAALRRSTATLHEWLDSVAADTGISPANTFLFGFSQGTMMSLHVGPQRKVAFGGIIGFSGRLLDAGLLATSTAKPPVLLVHGDADPMVPFESLAIAADALKANGFAVTTHRSPGVAHGIAPDGLGLALRFIQGKLPPRQ